MISGTRPQQSGFTIIEVIVFLSVSIVLVASALALFSTRIPRTQFAQAVNELDIKFRSVGNDVLNGFYPNAGNISCTSGGGIQATPGSEQGENADCIFLGRAIQIGEEGDCTTQECDQFRIYTIWGQRQSGDDVATSLTQAQPKITDVGVETYTTGFGLGVTKVIAPPNTNGVAYMSTFGSRPAGSIGASPTGAAQVEIRPLSIGGSGVTGLLTNQFGDDSVVLGAGSGLGDANPPNGIALCLKSGTSNQYAILTLGDAGRPLSNNVEILSEPEWNTRCNP